MRCAGQPAAEPPAQQRARITASATATACPVERIGRQLAVLQAEHLACDEALVGPDAPAKGSAEDAALGRRFDRLTDAIERATHGAAERQATSLGGVMLHTLLLRDAAQDLGVNGHEPAERDLVLARAGRHAASAVVCLARHSGVRPEEVGGDYLLTRDERAWIADALAEAGIPAAPIAPPVDVLAEAGIPVTERDQALGESGPEFASVEAQLLDLNRQATAWAGLYGRAGDMPGLTGENPSAHAVRVLRKLAIQGLCLPATSVRELALQARLVAWDLSEWWDDNERQDGELACRALLDRLMGLGGVARLASRDFTVAEIEAAAPERARAASAETAR